MSRTLALVSTLLPAASALCSAWAPARPTSPRCAHAPFMQQTEEAAKQAWLASLDGKVVPTGGAVAASGLGVGSKMVKSRLPVLVDKLIALADSTIDDGPLVGALKFVMRLQARSFLQVFTVVSAVAIFYLDLCVRAAWVAGSTLVFVGDLLKLPFKGVSGVSLPSVSLPSVSLPSAPKLPTPSLPSAKLPTVKLPSFGGEEAAKRAWLKRLESRDVVQTIKKKRTNFLSLAREKIVAAAKK